ncbi:hypothetical protein IMSHALPRED_001529, partial [Imshaugia aleurites]
VAFTVGPLNTTRVLELDLATLSFFNKDDDDDGKVALDLNDIFLYMNLSALGHLPNSNLNPCSTPPTETLFTHESYLPLSPSLAHANLINPSLELKFDAQTGKFVVEAKTGVAVWTWLDYDTDGDDEVTGLIVFEGNGFLALRGRRREVGVGSVGGAVVGSEKGGSKGGSKGGIRGLCEGGEFVG